MEKKAPELLTPKNVEEHLYKLIKELKLAELDLKKEQPSISNDNLKAIQKKIALLRHVSSGNPIPLQSYHDLTAYSTISSYGSGYGLIAEHYGLIAEDVDYVMPVLPINPESTNICGSAQNNVLK